MQCRSSLGLLAVLATGAMLLSVFASYRDATAQGCSGLSFALVYRDGKLSEFRTCEGWTGIDQHGLAEPADWLRGKGKAVPRSGLRFICPSYKCPGNLPSAETSEDTVVWTNGSTTRGSFELRCTGVHICRVFQGGKDMCPPQKDAYESCWRRYVSYVELAAQPKGQ